MNTKAEPAAHFVAEPCRADVQFDTGRVAAPGGGEIVLTLGYRRSTDFDERNDPGQDFAVVRAEGRYAVGVVADGVSQSFFGEIAAQHIAQGMAEFLWSRNGNPPDTAETVEVLRRLSEGARREVAAKEIPRDLPHLVQTALERIRDAKGSQAVFSAFSLDVLDRTVTLYMVGDAGVVLHDGTPAAAGTLVQATASGRWGSTGSTALHLRTARYGGVSAVVLRSDGARDWGDVLDGSFSPTTFHDRALDLAHYDDVSFVSVEIEERGGNAPLQKIWEEWEEAPPEQPQALAASPPPPPMPEPAPAPAPELKPERRPDRGDRGTVVVAGEDPPRRKRLQVSSVVATLVITSFFLGGFIGTAATLWWTGLWGQISGGSRALPRNSAFPPGESSFTTASEPQRAPAPPSIDTARAVPPLAGPAPPPERTAGSRPTPLADGNLDRVAGGVSPSAGPGRANPTPQASAGDSPGRAGISQESRREERPRVTESDTARALSDPTAGSGSRGAPPPRTSPVTTRVLGVPVETGKPSVPATRPPDAVPDTTRGTRTPERVEPRLPRS